MRLTHFGGVGGSTAALSGLDWVSMLGHLFGIAFLARRVVTDDTLKEDAYRTGWQVLALLANGASKPSRMCLSIVKQAHPVSRSCCCFARQHPEMGSFAGSKLFGSCFFNHHPHRFLTCPFARARWRSIVRNLMAPFKIFAGNWPRTCFCFSFKGGFI